MPNLISPRRLHKAIGLLVVCFLLSSLTLFASAKITIVNGNAPGVGFNDPTPVAPVGGNPGTTLGAQRLNAFQFAANIWGGTLSSDVEILILATFEPLSCTASSAVLGSSGTMFIFSDFPSIFPFPGPEYPNTWYHSALAKKRAGFDFAPYDPTQGQADMRARFNSNLGKSGCLTGTFWYLGFDNNHGNNIDLVTVLLHEFAHGLGFSQFASVTSGAEINGMTDVYGRDLLDVTLDKTWDQMTDAERTASAINTRKVVWSGPNVTNAIPVVLSLGTPFLKVNTPAAVAGNYDVGTASFGPPLSSPGISGPVILALDAANTAGPSTTDACSPLTNASDVMGKIALVDRGTCSFVIKVKNAQNAGAIAVLVADNVAGSPPAGLGGADPSINIPAVRITLADGNTIKAQLASGAGVTATLTVDLSVRAGADANGRALLNTPNPVQPGSSISHWDPIAFPNQLMEPAINSDLTHSVTTPQDLTLSLLGDVGWFCTPNLDRRSTVIIDSCNSGVPNVLLPSDCTIADLIHLTAARARNHGDFVSSVAAITDRLKRLNVISGVQKGAIQSCAAGAAIP